LAQLTGSAGKIADLARIDHRGWQSRGNKLGDETSFKSAAGLEHHQRRRDLFQALNQRGNATRIMFLAENLFARQHCDIESGLTHVYSDHHFTFHPYTCLFRPSPSLHDAGSLGGPGDCSGFDLAQWARRPTLPAGLLRPRVLRPTAPRFRSILK
jgi:hypothetical protein